MKIRGPLRLVIMIMVLVTCLTACAAAEVAIELNGTGVNFTEETGHPFIDENQRTQVPLRITMENFGCEVGWNNDTKTATVQKKGMVVEVPVGKNIILVNGKEVQNDTVAMIRNGRTYLPIRAVLENFGAKVRWNGDTRTVIALGNGILPVKTVQEKTEQERNEQKKIEQEKPEVDALAELYIHFIDVGQADAILIDNGGYEVLIDAGNNKDGKTVVQEIKPYVDGNLELMIATHPDADHIGGLDTVLENYQVDEVIDGGATKSTVTYKEYFQAVQDEPDCILSYDEDCTIDLGGTAKLDIIETGDGYKDANDNSVVSLLRYGDISVLLTGDMEAEAEAASLLKYQDVDVLKAGHHGSRTSSSKEFLDIVKPEYIIVSAGIGNTYGHPHQEALQRFFDAKATVYGTFLSGNIVMTTNGKTYFFDTDKKVGISDAGKK